MSRAVAALTLLAVGATAVRAGATETRAEVRFEACEGAFDANEAVVLLERELRAAPVGPVALSVVPSSSAADGIDVRVAVVCEDADAVSVRVSRRAASAPAEATSSLSLAAIPQAARARLVALSAAETARFLVSEADALAPPASTVLPPATVPSPPLTPSLRLTRPRSRLRLMRGMALGLGALTVASAVVGAVLASMPSHHHDHHGGDVDDVGPAVAFGIGGASLVGTSVDIGLWMRERNLSPTPLASGAAPSLLEISF